MDAIEIWPWFLDWCDTEGYIIEDADLVALESRIDRFNYSLLYIEDKDLQIGFFECFFEQIAIDEFELSNIAL